MMRPVSQHELKRVFSGRQFNKRLGLPGAEMKMLLVLRDRFIRVERLISVDQEMVVAGVRRLDSRGRDAHAREAELHPERTGDDIAVLRADDINHGTRWRAVSASATVKPPMIRT